jgi:tRNA modification GTPase
MTAMNPRSGATDKGLPVRCVAARISPPGPSAVAIVRVVGPDAVALVMSCLDRPLTTSSPPPRVGPSLRVARWKDGEPVVVRMRSEEEVEVSCHGGAIPVARVLDELRRRGALILSWEELVWATSRSAIEAEAQIALTRAMTCFSAELLVAQASGLLEGHLRTLLSRLREGSVQDVQVALEALQQRARLGVHLVEPWKVVLVGRPNVGKSSLLNAVAGYPRAIVHDQPGTTRDVLTERVTWDGWLLELHDTAGLREVEDPLEAEGIRRALRQSAEADLVWLVLDSSTPPTSMDGRLLEEFPQAVRVRNKADLPAAWDAHDLSSQGIWVDVSALARTGIEELLCLSVERLAPEAKLLRNDEPLLFTPRQVRCVEEARGALAQGERARAEAALRELLEGSAAAAGTTGAALHQERSGPP